MKSKTITSCILIGLIFSNILVFAQEEEQNANNVLAKMKAKLSLTQVQTAAIKPIIEEYADKYQHLIQNSGQLFTDKRSIRRQIDQLGIEENEKLSQILTPDQMKKWDQHEGVKDFLNQDEIDNSDKTPDNSGSHFGVGTSF